MEPYDTFRAFYKEQSAPHARQHHPDVGQSADVGPSDPSAPTPVTQPPRRTSQAERAAIHPDRHDLEWHYCRGPWVG